MNNCFRSYALAHLIPQFWGTREKLRFPQNWGARGARFIQLRKSYAFCFCLLLNCLGSFDITLMRTDAHRGSVTTVIDQTAAIQGACNICCKSCFEGSTKAHNPSGRLLRTANCKTSAVPIASPTRRTPNSGFFTPHRRNR